MQYLEYRKYLQAFKSKKSDALVGLCNDMLDGTFVNSLSQHQMEEILLHAAKSKTGIYGGVIIAAIDGDVFRSITAESSADVIEAMLDKGYDEYDRLIARIIEKKPFTTLSSSRISRILERLIDRKKSNAFGAVLKMFERKALSALAQADLKKVILKLGRCESRSRFQCLGKLGDFVPSTVPGNLKDVVIELLSEDSPVTRESISVMFMNDRFLNRFTKADLEDIKISLHSKINDGLMFREQARVSDRLREIELDEERLLDESVRAYPGDGQVLSIDGLSIVDRSIPE